MDISGLLEKRKQYEAGKDSIPEAALVRLEKEFETEFIYNSNALAGNTLTLEETKMVLEKGIASGKKSIREIEEEPPGQPV